MGDPESKLGKSQLPLLIVPSEKKKVKHFSGKTDVNTPNPR